MATHDYVLDNATGANFRSDLNNALAAIVSNNSSSTEPSTKYAYQWWADTNEGVLKIRNSSNDGWVTLLQLDGTLTLEDGSASAPALGFRDDLNTGIFSSAADTVDVTCGGTTRGSFSSSGLSVTGNVTATTFVGNIDAVDGDFDGTLEADAITVAGTALSTVIAGTTLTQAAQTNITSLGTLTGLTLSGDMTFTGDSANIVFDKSDSQLEFADNAKAEFGTGGDLEIFHNGTDSRIVNTTGDLSIRGSSIKLASTTGEEYFRGTANGSAELFHDNVVKLTTNADGYRSNDNVKAQFGVGSDLTIYHDGSNSYIDNDTGTFIIRSDGGGMKLLSDANIILRDNDDTTNMVRCINGGQIELYHNGSKKAETVSGGFTISGTCTATAFSGDGSGLTGVSGGGKILQVVQQTKTDTATHSVNINQGAANFSLIMSKSITPSNSSNKILVQFSISGNVEANGAHVDFVLRKTVGSTVTHPILGDSASGYTSITTGFRSGGGNQHNVGQCIYQFLDDAGTTSAITYGVAVATEGASTYRVNASGGDLSSQTWSSRQASTIVLMEVSA